MNILFVCTGNTCRSPMAAAIMAKIAEENDMDVYSESAGLLADQGKPASANAVKAMERMGIDLSSHRTKQVTQELLDQCDLVLTMTEGHKMMLAGMAGLKNVYTLAEYAGSDGDIQDPFGGDISEYDDTAKEIYDIMVDVAERLEDEMRHEGK